jgi:hypothetical protein
VVGVIVLFRRFINSVVGGFFFCFGCLSLKHQPLL